MIRIKSALDIEILREGGQRHARIMDDLIRAVTDGVSTAKLNQLVSKLIENCGDRAAFLNYRPAGAIRPYPASLCVSVGSDVVHGIPSERRILKVGDVVSLDFGLLHRGLVTDMAVTVGVGRILPEAEKLIEVTRLSLEKGIEAARSGRRVGDIGFAIESFVKPYGYGIVRELAGHGVGYSVHEDPYVPNYGVEGEGEMLRCGMVIAIEPMLSLGSGAVKLSHDGFTYRTADGSIASHFEHTILIKEGESEVLTALERA